MKGFHAVKNGETLALICALAALTVGAKTNTLVNGASDWRSPDSFEERVEILPGDTVLVPPNCTGTVYDDSAALVSSLERIVLQTHTTSCIIIDISTNTTFGCTINDGIVGQQYFGKVVKRGAGEAFFAAYTRTGDAARPEYVRDFAVRLEVEEGDVRFPDLTAIVRSKDTDKRYFYVPYITLAEGTRVFTPGGCALLMKYLNGSGSVTNAYGHTSKYDRIQIAYDLPNVQVLPHSDFYGSIDGIGYDSENFTQVGRINLHGTNSNFTGVFRATENATKPSAVWTGITSFGKTGYPSSIGMHQNIFLSASRLIYLGKGETTDKRIFLRSSIDAPAIIDGGEHGGLTLSENIYNGSGAADAMHRRLEFTGDHTNACRMTGTFPLRPKNGVYYTCHLTKSGTGVWHLDTAASGMAGGIAVENGTLRFNTIANKGIDSSLGTATILTDAYAGADYLNHKVDYAFLLGGIDGNGAATEGTLEYVGTGSPCVTDRPFAIRTAGRIRANGGSALELGNFYGLGAGGKTLTLDGDGEFWNKAIDVRDGEGCVSIVKDGGGSWILAKTSGEYAFTGSLDVNGGVLAVAGGNNVPFSWFRLRIKENAYAAGLYTEYAGDDKSTSTIMLHKFMLFDADGTAQAVGLEEKTPGSALQPGEMAYRHADRLQGYASGRSTSLSNLVNVISGNRSQCTAVNLLDAEDDSTWIDIDMRLTNGAPPIASFDYSFYYSTGTLPDYASRQNPTAMELLGSSDGINWESLWSTNGMAISGYRLYWEGSRQSISTDATLRNTLSGHSSPFLLHHLSPTNVANVGECVLPVESFSVADGATLRSEGGTVKFVDDVTWRISADGAGRLEGFALPESGTIEVENFTGGDREFQLPVECVDVTGLGNVINWTLSVGSVQSSKWRVTVRDGGVWLVPTGFRFIVR